VVGRLVSARRRTDLDHGFVRPRDGNPVLGHGKPSPDWDGGVRQGDNLYADSAIAVDPATGRRKWHLQFTPHDVWDSDACSQFFLVDLELEGRVVPALVTDNRNGYLFWLDRTNGKFLRAQRYLDHVDWALRIEPDGRLWSIRARFPARSPRGASVRAPTADPTAPGARATTATRPGVPAVGRGVPRVRSR